MPRKPLAFTALFAMALFGCGDKSSSSTPATTAAGTTGATTSPASAPGELKDLKTEDTKVGTGDAAKVGDEVWVLYTGKLKDGTIFDSTDKHDNTPFSVVIGQGQVIQGWEKGLVGMKVGGERKLSIPWSMAYGDQGHDTIPAKSDLYFDIKMVAMVAMGEEKTVTQKDDKVGTGPEVKEGDKVTVDYTVSLPTGKEVSTTYEPHKPITFVVGKNQAIDGMDAGVRGMKVGGIRTLVVPPLVGPAGTPNPSIPPRSVLTFKVELKKIG